MKRPSSYRPRRIKLRDGREATLRAMSTLLENDLPVSLVMQAVDGPLIVKRTPETPTT